MRCSALSWCFFQPSILLSSSTFWGHVFSPALTRFGRAWTPSISRGLLIQHSSNSAYLSHHLSSLYLPINFRNFLYWHMFLRFHRRDPGTGIEVAGNITNGLGWRCSVSWSFSFFLFLLFLLFVLSLGLDWREGKMDVIFIEWALPIRFLVGVMETGKRIWSEVDCMRRRGQKMTSRDHRRWK